MFSETTRSLALCELAPSKDHRDEIGRARLAGLGEELAHSRSVHLAAQPPIQAAFERARRAVDVDELALVSASTLKTCNL
jgi:hypothetical protein